MTPTPACCSLADNTVAGADPAAQRWLADLEATGPPAPLPPVVRAVATRADVEAGAAAVPAARARVRAPSGAWLVVRGSVLGGDDEVRTAVTIERARAHDLAPLIAEAHDLTARERAVAQLVAQGLATDAIAERLRISPWTVQDHLKSIFEKVGVGSRGELVARLFFEHYAPRLAEGGPVGPYGFFMWRAERPRVSGPQTAASTTRSIAASMASSSAPTPTDLAAPVGGRHQPRGVAEHPAVMAVDGAPARGAPAPQPEAVAVAGLGGVAAHECERRGRQQPAARERGGEAVEVARRRDDPRPAGPSSR